MNAVHQHTRVARRRTHALPGQASGGSLQAGGADRLSPKNIFSPFDVVESGLPQGVETPPRPQSLGEYHILPLRLD
ncbi:Hypothetical protein SMAX5B_013686 [Scophthalmus maximus]|uniref:Uncharacterized protein n=1 Tax=Scophthalmus maximus TaxID=52904 RepID=A0A2U9B035_SCOMX|nr:Hypothetical protein SMAX5B_013686 [Scophthalmus maximus]